MKNFNNYEDIDLVNSQLKRADVQKSRLISDIYREYELYLHLVRDLLCISVQKGLNGLLCDSSVKNFFFNSNEIFCTFQKKISELIKYKLPLITVEQLKIDKFGKNINQGSDFNGLGSSKKINLKLEDKSRYEPDLQNEEPLKFKISDDFPTNAEYYQAENNEKFGSLDLDQNSNVSFLSNNSSFEDIGLGKQFISSLLELLDEVKFVKPRYFDNHNMNKVDISHEYQNLKSFDLIDNSLENLLLNLSYKINEELFNANLIKKMISQDSFEYLVGKKLMMKHPHPFVINFELNIDQSKSYGNNLPNNIFFNVSTVELEYVNLNLSIQKKKINELKNQFQRLIKKEKYWRQKEIYFNKIH